MKATRRDLLGMVVAVPLAAVVVETCLSEKKRDSGGLRKFIKENYPDTGDLNEMNQYLVRKHFENAVKVAEKKMLGMRGTGEW